MRTTFDAAAVAERIIAKAGDDVRAQSTQLYLMFPGLRRSSRWRAVADELNKRWMADRIKRAAAAAGHDTAYA